MADTNLIEIFCTKTKKHITILSIFAHQKRFDFLLHPALRKSKKQHLAKRFHAMMELFFVFFALKAML